MSTQESGQGKLRPLPLPAMPEQTEFAPGEVDDPEAARAAMAEMQEMLHRYGPFAVMTDREETMVAADVMGELFLMYDGEFDAFLQRLDALAPLYPDCEHEPDAAFFTAVFNLIAQFNAMLQGEVLLDAIGAFDFDDEDFDEDDFFDDEDDEDFDDDNFAEEDTAP